MVISARFVKLALLTADGSGKFAYSPRSRFRSLDHAEPLLAVSNPPSRLNQIEIEQPAGVTDDGGPRADILERSLPG